MAGLHGVDGDAGPLFKHEPTATELQVAAELLETLGGDGRRLLAAVAPMLRYVLSRFSTCQRFGGAVVHLRAWAAKAVDAENKRKAAAADNARRKQVDAAAASAVDQRVADVDAFRRLPAGDAIAWRAEAVRKFPALAGLSRNGPNDLVDQVAADLWRLSQKGVVSDGTTYRTE